MPEFVPRAAADTIARRLSSFPVVAITGARQTGKSTLARRLEPDRLYLSLDSIEVRGQAAQAPDELVRRADRVTLDEGQRAPDVLLAIKRVIDEKRTPGQFLVTGSADLLLMQRVADSLAGRALYVTLWPLTRREKLGLGSTGPWSLFFEEPPTRWPSVLPPDPSPSQSWTRLVQEGGYPDPGYHHRDDPEVREDWFQGYVRTYLERDLRDLAQVQDLAAFQRLMRAAALRLGGLLNQSELARDVGLPVSTVQRYLGLMQTSYQLVPLEPFSINRTKRLVKSPKIFWSDTGLARYIADEPRPAGAYLENLVLQDLLVWRELEPRRPQVLYWRTYKGAEVDFVIERGERVLPVEVKASRTVAYRDARHLKTFLEEYPDLAPGALLLYDGDAVFWLADRVLAVPWGRVV